MWGVGCGVWCVGCGVWGVGCGVWGVGCGVWGVGCGAWGSGCEVLCVVFRPAVAATVPATSSLPAMTDAGQAWDRPASEQTERACSESVQDGPTL